MAVPGAIANWTSITELTGTTFHLRERVVPDEIASHRVRIGHPHGGLPDRIHHGHAHRQQRGRVAIVQMQIVVVRTTSLLDLQAEARIERLFTRPANPEMRLARLAHLDQAFLQNSRPDHHVMDLEAPLGGECFAATADFGNRRHTMLLPSPARSPARPSLCGPCPCTDVDPSPQSPGCVACQDQSSFYANCPRRTDTQADI